MSRTSYFVTLFALALVLHSGHVFSEPTNVTVDDTNGDPRTGNQFTYFPSSNVWNLGQSCGSICWAQVNASLAYMSTWHDVTWHVNDALISAQLPFQGSAVYVYGILELDPSTTNLAAQDITFFIDDERVGHYTQQYILGQNGTEYNVLLFANNSLNFDTHNLTIQVGGTTGIQTCLLLDYVIYTFDDQTTTSASGPSAVTTPPSIVNSTDTQSAVTTPSSVVNSTDTQSAITIPPSFVNSTHTQPPASTSPSSSTAIATSDGSPTTLSTSRSDVSHTPLIIGTTCGVIGLVIISVALLWWHRRLHGNQITVAVNQNSQNPLTITPFLATHVRVRNEESEQSHTTGSSPIGKLVNTGRSGPVESQQLIDRGPAEKNKRLRRSLQPPRYRT